MVAISPPVAPPPARGVRPSLRAVAKAVGVSAMTVSRVLREHSKVSPGVRARVLQAARELGYRPDPDVAKLMQHLRQRRKPAYQSSLCALTTVQPGEPISSYLEGVMRGAQQQADTRGYGFTTVHIGDERNPRNLQRMLRSRGVEGLILMPMAKPASLAGLLDWREFSVVAATSSVLAPEVHCVMPHHFKNAQLLCAQLCARGYRRIGLVLSHQHTERTYHAYPAATAWHGALHAGAFVPPLLYSGHDPRGLAAWFEREQPDAIVTITDGLCRRLAQTVGLEIPGRIAFAATHVVPGSPIAGVDELTFNIGASAIDLLASMVQRGEKGVPAAPALTQLLGRWVEGISCPVRNSPPPPPGAGANPRLVDLDS